MDLDCNAIEHRHGVVYRGACPISIEIVCAADWIGRGEHAFTYVYATHATRQVYEKRE